MFGVSGSHGDKEVRKRDPAGEDTGGESKDRVRFLPVNGVEVGTGVVRRMDLPCKGWMSLVGRRGSLNLQGEFRKKRKEVHLHFRVRTRERRDSDGW